MILRRHRDKPPVSPAAELDSLLIELDELQARTDGQGDAGGLLRLRQLRHVAGIKLVEAASPAAGYPELSGSLPDPSAGVPPDLAPAQLTAGLLRAAILRDGCAVVRGLVPQGRAQELAEELTRVFDRRAEAVGRAEAAGTEAGSAEVLANGGRAAEGDGDLLYVEFVPDPPYFLIERPWVYRSGGIWLADSPRLMAEVFHLYDHAGLRRLVAEYLGGRPVLSVNKSTLRRAHASVSSIDWHQDGAFMGDVRTLNVWLSLSHCGESAPGLVMAPRRIEQFVATGTPGAAFGWSVAPELAEQAAGEAGTLHPTFAPGDAVLFDDHFLHATWVHPGMHDPRLALESWFFSPAGFPKDYVPLAF